ncbi:hypothetical protein CDL15_Pgr014045 [Punica granatum]|uniref:Disease resistance protein At4g27190-like leucine-rich repeats domain-containing protein n=1 Tax=Punica granatum TaxID=22663 RepID=A0A218W9P5_PUNGR|nr:hypothetical protein CDL15_Pgr014045 [Punica granatum]
MLRLPVVEHRAQSGCHGCPFPPFTTVPIRAPSASPTGAPFMSFIFPPCRFAWTRVLAVERFAVTSAIFNAFSLLFKLRKLEELIFADASLEVLFPWEVAPLALVNKDNSGNVVAAPLRRLTLVAVVPTDKSLLLSWLRKLEIRNCGAVVEVFEPLRADAAGDVELLSSLGTLHLRDLPMLRLIFPKGFHRTRSFMELHTIQVHNCSRLLNVLTPNMVKSLARLLKIEIKDCTMLEEIIAKEKEDEEILESIIR